MASKSSAKQQSLFGNFGEVPEEMLCTDYTKATTYRKRIQCAADFIAERHNIYIRRNSGQKKPWTNDPIMRAYRFCNIYRELDKVTVWIMENWIKPYVDTDTLAMRALVGRLINHPDTLQLMLNTKGCNLVSNFSQKAMWRLFQEIKSGGNKLVTGAYIVNTIPPKDFQKVDGSKGDYIANFFIPMVWKHRKELQEGMKSGSFQQSLDAMCTMHGVGRFIGNQAVVDLSYTKHLSKAKDLNTTWSPGPGTCKGINWIVGEKMRPGSQQMLDALTAYRNDVNKALEAQPNYSPDMKKLKTHIVPMTAPDSSNSLCELSKHVWLATGKRDRLKNTYKGV